MAQPSTSFASTTTTETVSGLTNGTSYTFTVAAINLDGTGPASAPSAPVTPTTVPAAPSAVSASPGNADASVDWTAPTDDGGSPITGYTITPYAGGVAQPSTSFASTTTTETVSGLTNGTSSTFTVAAINLDGTGPASAPSAPVIPITVPAAPSAVSASPGNADASVDWTAPTDDGGSPITGYMVTVWSGGAPQFSTTFASTATTETVSGLTNGTSYTFTVAAINADGLGYSSPASAPVTPSTVPAAPSSVSATPGDDEASVGWIAPTDDGGSPITGYTVTPYAGGVAQPSTTFDSTATTEYVMGLSAGVSYSFTVAAINANGTGTASAPSAPVTPTTVPAAPSAVSASPGNADASVDWTAPTDDGGSPITGYTITPYAGGVAQPSTSFASTTTTETVSGLTNGTSYTFTVAAINLDGTGPASAPSAPVTPTTVPAAPSAVSASPGNADASVDWTAPTDDGGSPITGYMVTVWSGGAPQFSTTFASTATTETVSGLTNGTSYTFTVAAINADGLGYSSPASAPVTPSTVPAAPSSVSATPGDDEASVGWIAPTDDGGSPITGYTVTPYAGGVAQPSTTFDSTATTEYVMGLSAGVSYSFTVAAINANGTGTASAPSAPVTPTTVPAAPSAVSASPGNADASVDWTAPTDDGGSPITGYTITPYAGGVAQPSTSFASTTTTETVSGLTNGTSYTFTVAAINLDGTGPASAPSAPVIPISVTSSLTITNGPGNSGRADAGDQITVVYGSPPDPSDFCSLWTSSSYPELSGLTVVVTGEQTSGDDVISSVADPLCLGGFHFGSIDLGQTGYFNTTVTFTGSTIQWNGTDTLTVTLGTPSIGDPTQNSPSVAVYTPDPALGLTGTIDSPLEVQF